MLLIVALVGLPLPIVNRLAGGEELPEFVVWVSTHPNSQARSEKVIEFSQEEDKVYKRVWNGETWNKLKTGMMAMETAIERNF